jgi:hypothetical protein
MRSLDSLCSSGFCRCSPRCARRILPAPPDSLAAHPDALAGFSRLFWILSLLTWMRSLDALGFSGFSRCSPGCARWILSAPLDSLGASGFSRCPTQMHSLGSLVAHPEALAGFCRFSPRCPRGVLLVPLDCLVCHDCHTSGVVKESG